MQAREATVPPGVLLEDGITEDEAVTVAIWNNAAFQEMLADLGLSCRQLLDAGLISDPQFVVLFPLGPKQLEFTTYQAIDALWLQPIRVRAAELDLNLVSQTMVQNGLNLIRDVRVTHADLVLATQQAEFTGEAAELREQIAELSRKRLAAGDISELEANTSAIDAMQAKAAADRAGHDVVLARERLRTLIGLAMFGDELIPIAPNLPAITSRNSMELVNEALALRPDLRAAEIAIQAACERSELARNQFMTLDAIYDANGRGAKGFESGLGLRFTLPIFNGNKGGIAIAEAQWEQMARRYVTLRDQIVLDVKTSHAQLQQAEQNLVALNSQILPALRDAEVLARSNYLNGGATYFLVLQTTGQYLDARLREIQLRADHQRAVAELDRSVGRRVSADALPVDPTAPTELTPPPLLIRQTGHFSTTNWSSADVDSLLGQLGRGL